MKTECVFRENINLFTKFIEFITHGEGVQAQGVGVRVHKDLNATKLYLSFAEIE